MYVKCSYWKTQVVDGDIWNPGVFPGLAPQEREIMRNDDVAGGNSVADAAASAFLWDSQRRRAFTWSWRLFIRRLSFRSAFPVINLTERKCDSKTQKKSCNFVQRNFFLFARTNYYCQARCSQLSLNVLSLFWTLMSTKACGNNLAQLRRERNRGSALKFYPRQLSSRLNRELCSRAGASAAPPQGQAGVRLSNSGKHTQHSLYKWRALRCHPGREDPGQRSQRDTVL